MRVIVIGSYAPSLVNFRGPLLATLADAGHEVIACAPGEDDVVTGTLARMGVTYRSIYLARGGMNPVQDLKAMLGLYRLFRQVKPDLGLGYTVKPVIYGSLAARLAGLPRYSSIITGLGFAFSESEHQDGVYWKRRVLSRVIKSLYRLSLASNGVVFFQNPDDRALFVRLGLVEPDKTMLINGSGVDLEHFAKSPLRRCEKLSFLMIARLIKDKGIQEYAEAATILKRKYPQTVFRLVGPFDRENPAGIAPSALAQWQDIEYLGATDDVRPFLTDADVFVLPSYYGEGTPRTVLEAMSVGRAIVTTDTPGCRETVVEGENGLLVPTRNATALAKVMEKFIVHPELITSMGKRSREIAEQKYDVHKVNSVILKTMGVTIE